MNTLVEHVEFTISEDGEYFYLLTDDVDQGLAIRKTSYNGEALTAVMSKLIAITELKAHRNQIGNKVRGLHEAFVRTQEDLVKGGLLKLLE